MKLTDANALSAALTELTGEPWRARRHARISRRMAVSPWAMANPVGHRIYVESYTEGIGSPGPGGTTTWSTHRCVVIRFIDRRPNMSYNIKAGRGWATRAAAAATDMIADTRAQVCAILSNGAPVVCDRGPITQPWPGEPTLAVRVGCLHWALSDIDLASGVWG